MMYDLAMGKTRHQISIGFQKGRLTVIGEAPRKKGYRQWLIRCECGTEKPMYSQQIYGEKDQSCGCYAHERRVEVSTKHGCCPRSGATPEYLAWREMVNRCHRDTHISYKNYGGRGISVCEQWRTDFKRFLDDVGPKPEGKYWLDRIDSNGNYEPGNVKWSTPKEQLRNTRRNRIVQYQGKDMCLAAVSEITGIRYPTLIWRLNNGWSFEKAFTVS